MRNVMVAAVLSIGLAQPAQAKSQYQLQFLPAQGQAEGWQNGIQYVDDVQPGSVVRVVNVADTMPDKQSTLRVIMKNTSGQPATFGSESVAIQFPGGGTVVMASYEDLDAKLRRDIKRRSFLAALGGALSAADANGYETGSFSYNGMASNGTTYSGMGSYSGVNPALAREQQAQVAAQNLAVSNAIQARQLSGKQALESMLRRSTVSSGAMTGGVVAYDPPPAFKKMKASEVVTVVVKVGGEVHSFAARLIELSD